MVGQPVRDHSVFQLFFSDDSGDIIFSMPETFGPATSGPWKLDYKINWSDLLTITVLDQGSAD